jgi:hypothetical protein
MVEAGLIDSAAERAAKEISAVYLAVTRVVMTKRQNLGPTFCILARGPAPEMPDGLAHAHAVRYMPWVKATGPDIVDATLRVCVEREAIPENMVIRVALALSQYARAFDRLARKAS